MSEQNLGEAPAPKTREPNVHSGGKQEFGAPLPPYEGHQASGPSQEELANDPQKTGEGSVTGPRDVSQAEREGVSPTDTTAASPHGVGDSPGTQGEEFSQGMSEASHRADQAETGVGGYPESRDDTAVTIVGDQGD